MNVHPGSIIASLEAGWLRFQADEHVAAGVFSTV